MGVVRTFNKLFQFEHSFGAWAVQLLNDVDVLEATRVVILLLQKQPVK